MMFDRDAPLREDRNDGDALEQKLQQSADVGLPSSAVVAAVVGGDAEPVAVLLGDAGPVVADKRQRPQDSA